MDSTANLINMLSVNLGIGYDKPYRDLKSRYGNNLNFNTGIEYLHKSNYSYGIDFTYLYGDNVKEDVLAPYRTERGYIIGLTGYGADVFLRERGGYLGFNIGKWMHGKSNHGLKIIFGAGILYHQIRILDDSRTLIIADAPYRKGFDRLTRGYALKQEVLYQFHSSQKSQHFNIGLTFTEGFTQQVREVNFDTGIKDQKKRKDILIGLKATWQMPLYKSKSFGQVKNEIKYY
jgi:hypothetical protein